MLQGYSDGICTAKQSRIYDHRVLAPHLFCLKVKLSFVFLSIVSIEQLQYQMSVLQRDY